MERLGKIHIKNYPIFDSLETVLALDRKFKHDKAVGYMGAFGGTYEAAIDFVSYDRETRIPQHFFDQLDIITVLDPVPPATSSCSVVEVIQDGDTWRVDIGYPSTHSWWQLNTLEEAVSFACEKASEINSADNPAEKLQEIINSR